MRISVGDSLSFNMSPFDYIDHWDKAPRLMAILEIIQDRMKFQRNKRIEEVGRRSKKTDFAGSKPNLRRIKKIRH